MKGLAITYVLKILFTLIFWCFPLLFKREFLREQLAIEQPLVEYLFLLLGWAYLALCVGYGVGLYQLLKYKQFNLAPIFAGIASNGGAAVLLTAMALNNQIQLGQFLFSFLLVSAAGATLVTVNLGYFLLRQK